MRSTFVNPTRADSQGVLWLYRLDPAAALWNASGVFAVVVLLIGAPQDLQGYALQLSIEAFSVAATR